MSEIKKLSSGIVYRNQWMTVREDKIQRASGAQGIYGIVDKPDFVAILAIESNEIHLVEQYRYPVQQRYWEIPQGSWESDPDADPEMVAAGELREETGLIANSLNYVGFLYPMYGLSNQCFHIYLASDFTKDQQQLDTEEEGLITAKFSIEEFESMIVNGTIKDGPTISAYSLAKIKNLI